MWREEGQEFLGRALGVFKWQTVFFFFIFVCVLLFCFVLVWLFASPLLISDWPVIKA